MLTFEPTTPQPVAEENIVLNDKVVGTVKPYVNKYAIPEEQFMASLTLAKDCDNPSMYSAGFGATREAAIIQAIERGKAQALQFIIELNEIRCRI